MEFDELVRAKTGLLMNFNVSKLKSRSECFVLLRALRVLRGETTLYLCESFGTSPFFFSYPLETRKSLDFNDGLYDDSQKALQNWVAELAGIGLRTLTTVNAFVDEYGVLRQFGSPGPLAALYIRRSWL